MKATLSGKNKKGFVELFLNFAKIGMFTFGGGYAMISMIESICVEQKKWITHDEFMNITVIAESTPGPIAINCATFTGYKKAGFWGAVVATLGIVAPSFMIIYFISLFFNHFLEISVIANAFKGIKIAVGILILDAAFMMVRKMKKSYFSVTVMLCSCAAMICINFGGWKVSSIAIMLLASIIGLASFAVKGIKK